MSSVKAALHLLLRGYSLFEPFSLLYFLACTLCKPCYMAGVTKDKLLFRLPCNSITRNCRHASTTSWDIVEASGDPEQHCIGIFLHSTLTQKPTALFLHPVATASVGQSAMSVTAVSNSNRDHTTYSQMCISRRCDFNVLTCVVFRAHLGVACYSSQEILTAWASQLPHTAPTEHNLS